MVKDEKKQEMKEIKKIEEKIDERIEEEIEESNKKMTLVGATLIAMVVTTVAGFIVLGITIWVQTYAQPRSEVHYKEVEMFDEERYFTYKDARKKWTDMRLDYDKIFRTCVLNKNVSDQELENFRQQQDHDIDQVRQATADITHFFGSSIHQILDYELNWYLLNRGCPQVNNMNEVTSIFVERRYRERMLMQLLLEKTYDPSDDNPYYNNPYYIKY